jgi:mannose-6-phosphate isomerase-like protein (cupin superfamily)
MPLQHPLVHVDDVTPENMQKGDGWAISEFRLPITGRDGSSTTIFHSIFRPGSTHARHLHSRCDEIAVYIKGHGIVGQSDEVTEVRPGYCRLMPKGSAHFFHNETKDEDGLVIGFYIGAKDVKDTGYEFRGSVTAADLGVPRSDGLKEGILLNVDDVQPLPDRTMNGWNTRDFRLPIGSHNGSSTALYWSKLAPGEVQHKHRLDNCEELYYVISGHGFVGAGEDRAEIRAGHVHFIPKGVMRFMVNTSRTEPLEVIGVYTGAGSIAETGDVYMGEVTEADMKTAAA